MFDRISIDPKVCHGQACLKGTRVPVHEVVGMLANGDTIESLLGAYPHLSREDVLACLEYAARLTRDSAEGERTRDLREWHGRRKEIWKGVEAEEYFNRLRGEWIKTSQGS